MSSGTNEEPAEDINEYYLISVDNFKSVSIQGPNGTLYGEATIEAEQKLNNYIVCDKNGDIRLTRQISRHDSEDSLFNFLKLW